MRLGDFEVEVLLSPNDIVVREITNRENHIYMRPREEFSLLLRNLNPSLRAEAQVSMQGKSQGRWRINQNTSIKISRPTHTDRKWAAFIDNNKAMTTDAAGLIVVEFRLEKKVFDSDDEHPEECDNGDDGDGGIKIVYAGASTQTFKRVDDLELDETIQPTIITIQFVTPPQV